MISRSLREGFRGVSRHWAMSISSAIAVTITLIIISIFIIFSWHLDKFTHSVESSVPISAQIAPAYEAAADEERIKEAIRAINGVNTITFRTKEEERDFYINSYDSEDARELFSEIYEGDDNPMLDAYYVTVKSGAQLEEITAEIRQIPGIYKASYGEQSTVSLMEAMFNVRRFGLYFVIAMGLLAVFLISNTIKLTIAARQDEITIMRNVGATNHFIRAPFLWEGVFTGLIGALAPIGLSIWGYMAAYRETGGILFSNMFKLSPPDPYVYYLAGVLAVLGVVVGFVGSWLSVSKYLRWKR